MGEELMNLITGEERQCTILLCFERHSMEM